MAEETEILMHQAEFLSSPTRHTGLIGGFGSGKTFIGVTKTIATHVFHSCDVAYYLPTYPLIKDIAFPKFSEILKNQNIPFELNKTDKDIITPYGRIILRSMDNPDLIVGYEVGYSLIDEADVLSTKKMKEVFVKALGRNRSVIKGDNKLDFVSTPEGFKFLYDFFVTNESKNKTLIKASTQDNPFIPEGFIESLIDSYTDAQLKAYMDGEFVNLTSGSVYVNYDRKLNGSIREVKRGDTLHIGMDFNITNMNAVIHVMDGDIKHAIDEITGAYDTSDMVRIIKERYQDFKILVYPDASGQNRSTSGSTDIKILKDARFTIKSPSKNPLVRDRVNVMNIAFKSNKGERTYFVNSEACPAFSQALENQTYKNGVPDKEGGFDHVNEAAGYFIFGSQTINKKFSLRA
jgi:hypothetical protein